MDLISLNLDGKQPAPPTESEFRRQAAILSAVFAVGVSLLLRFTLDAPLLPELLADLVFALMPIRIVEAGVSLLGPFAKHAAFIGCVVVHCVVLAALADAGLHWATIVPPGEDRDPVASGRLHHTRIVLVSASILVISAFVLVPLLGGGLLGRGLRQGSMLTLVSLVTAATVQGVALMLAPRLLLQHREPRAQLEGRLADRLKLLTSRRRLLRWAGYAVVGIATYDVARSWIGAWLQGRSGRVRGGTGLFPYIDGLAHEITPTEDFYEVSKNAFDPAIDVRGWTFEITGLVDAPLSYTYDQLKSLPAVEQYATLECISNEVGGNLIGNALWRGVRLKDLLDSAVLKAGVVDVVLRAADGYTDSIPLDRAIAEGTLLAYEMNGAPLTPVHGFPLRLIVPGIFGMKNVKWITGIEAVDFDFKGYWQTRGWDDRAEYKTMSRIDSPNGSARAPVTLAGVAFAGDRAISKVEVSTDGGRTWQPAVLKPSLSSYSWVLWHYEWSATESGARRITTRATDGNGIVQTAELATPIPNGASGYHQRVIQVEP
jgi:hypothetical protein